MTTVSEAPVSDASARRVAPDASLRALEAEAIQIVREVVAEFDRPALLFSGGKDSAVLLHVARKALAPAPLPITLLHVDTGHNLPEVLEFRDRVVAAGGHDLVVASVQQWIDDGRLTERPDGTRNPLQTIPLLDTIAERRFDAVLGGARRDEDRARAKERIFSIRDAFGGWDPRTQRPELWNLYNGRIHAGEHMRIFPLSNWTELDIWAYIARERIDIPPIYFAHQRRVFERDGMLFTESEFNPCREGETVTERTVRFRTVGDLTLTGCLESQADTVDKIIDEVAASRVTERGATRGDDKFSEAAMEDRKKQGYF